MISRSPRNPKPAGAPGRLAARPRALASGRERVAERRGGERAALVIGRPTERGLAPPATSPPSSRAPFAAHAARRQRATWQRARWSVSASRRALVGRDARETESSAPRGRRPAQHVSRAGEPALSQRISRGSQERAGFGKSASAPAGARSRNEKGLQECVAQCVP